MGVKIYKYCVFLAFLSFTDMVIIKKTFLVTELLKCILGLDACSPSLLLQVIVFQFLLTFTKLSRFIKRIEIEILSPHIQKLFPAPRRRCSQESLVNKVLLWQAQLRIYDAKMLSEGKNGDIAILLLLYAPD